MERKLNIFKWVERRLRGTAGNLSCAPAAPARAAIGRGDVSAAGVAVDVLVIAAAEVARDVAAVAVLARDAVRGAALPPDAPPDPLQHRRCRRFTPFSAPRELFAPRVPRKDCCWKFPLLCV